ncbi:MAG: hypothetical protein COB04_18455 [Gammaproteobacteria bacterium]|nr:MAG: hypothetical protein COB04_18455 [Gammaproteobacteria bacterium]
MGNRCDHDRKNLRLCDLAKRGKGGQHPIIGIVSGYVSQAATRRNRLTAWQRLNKTGRKRRSEAREAMAAVVQFLFAKEYQLDSRRCAKREGGYHKAVDADLIARQISQTKAWAGKAKMSEARVRAVIGDLVRCGYVTLSKQTKRQLPTGEWQSSPKVIQFTKAFFVDLGGKKLWKRVLKTAQERSVAIGDKYRAIDPSTAAQRLNDYFRLSQVFSPRQAARMRKILS